MEFFGGISQEEASWRAQDDRWTVLEIVNHLIDIEKEDFRFEFKIILENPEIIKQYGLAAQCKAQTRPWSVYGQEMANSIASLKTL